MYKNGCCSANLGHSARVCKPTLNASNGKKTLMILHIASFTWKDDDGLEYTAKNKLNVA